MKTFEKWLEKCRFQYTVKEDTIGKEYNFGKGIILVKYYKKNGGIIYYPKGRFDYGSNERLIKGLQKLLE